MYLFVSIYNIKGSSSETDVSFKRLVELLLFGPVTGVPEEYINQGRDVKVITEIAKNGNTFVVQRIRPKKTTSNSLTLGQECEIDTIKGDKVKVC